METRASYVLIGAFTLLALFVAMLFALWIGKSALDQEWDYYDIVFSEAVTGLTVGGAVQYNGIQVGEVRRLGLDPKDPRRAIAYVRVAGGTPIKRDTRAKLTFTGLTGVAIIQLSGGTPASPPLVAKEGETRPTIIADESAIQKLLSSSEDIITSVNDIMLRVSKLLDQKNLDRIAASLDHIEKLTGALAERSGDIGSAVDDIAQASRLLRETLAGTEELMQRLDAIAASTDTLLR
jgi:phospholipid/cholesterol/gamma-HCH transport system substrate-binding protein